MEYLLFVLEASQVLRTTLLHGRYLNTAELLSGAFVAQPGATCFEAQPSFHDDDGTKVVKRFRSLLLFAID